MRRNGTLPWIAVVFWGLSGAHAAPAMVKYPAKPVRIIVATGAGGSDDFIARSVREFADLARSRPGKLSFATLGAGQIPCWGALYLNTTAGIDALEVQYRNPADMITDIIAGRVDYAVMGIFNAVTSKEKLRVLGVTSRTRPEMLPDVPANG